MEPFQMKAIFVVIFVVGAAQSLYRFFMTKRRHGELSSWAEQRGWTWVVASDKVLAEEFGFVDRLQAGWGRRSIESLRGEYLGHEIVAFTHRLISNSGGGRTSSRSGSSNRSKRTYHAIVALRLDTWFPELKVGRENTFKRMGHLLTGSDIDIDSVEFSRKFEVQSESLELAHSFCNAMMVEYLLTQPIASVEVENNWLVLVANGDLKVDELERRLTHLHRIRQLMPDELVVPR